MQRTAFVPLCWSVSLREKIMPSYFNSEEAIKVFFAKETDTAEKKKMYRKLHGIWTRAVRVGGTKGSFYYQRSCSSIKGKPILIFEPQGGIDRGLFQEISRFGEVLEGKFVCLKNGYIELHVSKDLNQSNLLKYARSIRSVIADVSGIMSGGGDDRVTIVTPRVKANKAKSKRLAEQKKREKKKAETEKKKAEALEKKKIAEERKAEAKKRQQEAKERRLARRAQKQERAKRKEEKAAKAVKVEAAGVAKKSDSKKKRSKNKLRSKKEAISTKKPDATTSAAPAEKSGAGKKPKRRKEKSSSGKDGTKKRKSEKKTLKKRKKRRSQS